MTEIYVAILLHKRVKTDKYVLLIFTVRVKTEIDVLRKSITQREMT